MSMQFDPLHALKVVLPLRQFLDFYRLDHQVQAVAVLIPFRFSDRFDVVPDLYPALNFTPVIVFYEELHL